MLASGGRPLLNLMSFGRADRDMRRIVTIITLLHGRLSKPRRRAAMLRLRIPGK